MSHLMLLLLLLRANPRHSSRPSCKLLISRRAPSASTSYLLRPRQLHLLQLLG
jgi:hypothetical protein